ncbi:isocitrate lyase/PEP mutase family protein [Bradyrhizobium sp. 14AA]
MRKRKSLRELAKEEAPLITPAAHDAFTARIIERAGFKALALGGSTMLAARFALPDIGLAALAEMIEIARDILHATELPCIVDGDDGYGDAKSVVRTIELYQSIGAGAVVLEDQIRVTKQSGNSRARSVVPVDEMMPKLRAAAESCSKGDTLLIARCDAYGLEGLDGCLRRVESYLKAGADGIFIPGIPSVEELARVGRAFKGTYLVVDMVDGRETWVEPSEFADIGFSQIVYPNFIMLRAMLAAEKAAHDLQAFVRGGPRPEELGKLESAREMFRELVRESRWTAVEQRFQ